MKLLLLKVTIESIGYITFEINLREKPIIQVHQFPHNISHICILHTYLFLFGFVKYNFYICNLHTQV